MKPQSCLSSTQRQNEVICAVWIELPKHQNLPYMGLIQSEVYVIKVFQKYAFKVSSNMTHHILTEPPTFLGSTQIPFSKSLDFSDISKVAYEISSRKPWWLHLFFNFRFKRWFDACVKFWDSYPFVKLQPTTLCKNGFKQKGFW